MGNYLDAVELVENDSKEKLCSIVDSVAHRSKIASSSVEIPASGETKLPTDSDAHSTNAEEP